MLRHWNSKYLRIWIALRFIAETVRSVVQARKTYAERNLMRRPLFTVCLCLVTIIAIMRILAGVGTGEDTGLPPDGSPVKITGRIDTRSSEEIILKSISIIQNDQEYSYSGKLQCELENMKTAMITAGAVTEKEKTLKIGQQIVLEGTFALFSTATNPGEFDAQAYYAAKGIGGRVRKAQILAAGEKYSFLREKLYGFRQVLHDRLAEVFPAKEASVMQTLLLGEKEELDAEVKALYQKNGIAHILSISGLHITLLGMGVYRLLKRLGLPVRAAAVGGAMLLLIYGVMVGMSVSASRAIGMYLLQMLGIFVGRTYDMLTGLGLMALLLVLQEPERLFDVSFLMSFGAVLGICILTPVFPGVVGKGMQMRSQKSKGYRHGFVPWQIFWVIPPMRETSTGKAGARWRMKKFAVWCLRSKEALLPVWESSCLHCPYSYGFSMRSQSIRCC